ncbi:MAG: ribosomal-protein-alanine N-acetyltransferase [Nitrospirae bacterium RBG_13_39_12]|nr:MAG: ribosomal-protein-alanine N-acetyltransferase [Nitrospirae bacterium RBG_13_39_12]
MHEILIRQMRVNDVTEIMEIERMIFSTPWSKSAFLNELQKLHSITKVALSGDNIIGYICANYIIDEGHILNLAVHPGFRRQGIATKLVKEILENLKEINCRYLFLEVRASNHDARKFYENLGFKAVGFRRNYYISPEEDAALMMFGL